MSDYYLVNGELRHYGVVGMKWGIRRSREQLSSKVNKLTRKNSKLQKDVNRFTAKERKYSAKSAAMQKRNSKYERTLDKANAKKAKYEYKYEKQLGKRNIDENKAAKYKAKSEKYNLKALKAASKLKNNKWAAKVTDVHEHAERAKYRIQKNERLMDMYSKTISAMDAGTIEQGRLFMQYVYND